MSHTSNSTNKKAPAFTPMLQYNNHLKKGKGVNGLLTKGKVNASR